MNLEEVIENSRADFEIHEARVFWDGLFEDCRSGTFEQNLPVIRGQMIRESAGHYSPSCHTPALRDLNTRWDLWKAAFKAGWEERDWSC